jgi:hypothetical protein
VAKRPHLASISLSSFCTILQLSPIHFHLHQRTSSLLRSALWQRTTTDHQFQGAVKQCRRALFVPMNHQPSVALSIVTENSNRSPTSKNNKTMPSRLACTKEPAVCCAQCCGREQQPITNFNKQQNNATTPCLHQRTSSRMNRTLYLSLVAVLLVAVLVTALVTALVTVLVTALVTGRHCKLVTTHCTRHWSLYTTHCTILTRNAV